MDKCKIMFSNIIKLSHNDVKDTKGECELIELKFKNNCQKIENCGILFDILLNDCRKDKTQIPFCENLSKFFYNKCV